MHQLLNLTQPIKSINLHRHAMLSDNLQHLPRLGGRRDEAAAHADIAEDEFAEGYDYVVGLDICQYER